MSRHDIIRIGEYGGRPSASANPEPRAPVNENVAYESYRCRLWPAFRCLRYFILVTINIQPYVYLSNSIYYFVLCLS